MSKVSLLMPTYNRPEWVGMSIESVLSQNADLELLILDHGSDPATKEALDRYTDSRIKRFRLEVNGSEGNPYAYLSQFATGDYLVLWTDDDVMIPNTLGMKVAFLDENPAIGMVFTPAKQNMAGDITSSAIGRVYGEDVLNGAVPVEKLIQGNVVTMMSAVFRAEFKHLLPEILNQGNGTGPLGDWAFWLGLSAVTDTAYLNTESVIIRLHGESDSAQRGMRQGGFLTYMIKIWDEWIAKGISISPDAWDRMRLGYLGVAISTPGKDMDFLFGHVTTFENFKARWGMA